MIIGTLRGDVKALEKLKNEAGSVEEFLNLAGDLANVSLVAAATKAAIGYDIEQKKEVIKRFVDGMNPDGTVRIKEVPVGETRSKKHITASDAMLKFLLSNRLPQYFSDTKNIVVRRSSKEVKANAEEEIKRFAGQLLEAVDVEFEPAPGEASKASGVTQEGQ